MKILPSSRLFIFSCFSKTFTRFFNATDESKELFECQNFPHYLVWFLQQLESLIFQTAAQNKYIDIFSPLSCKQTSRKRHMWSIIFTICSTLKKKIDVCKLYRDSETTST